ncbi:hypothetical protein EDD37DRAFT_651418 [Exophiala viscosa]|uniref:uncharacterized protein n=1 Tax=Exophiala viscosa TaxID=2486360 RepID=UPI0021988C2E|nr:hypothetical protein EDD37DRAFT_651418 [Exophiala viscosa]
MGLGLSSLIVAALSLLAISITLATHNTRPLPEWPFGISINVLVSIFSVIFKAAVSVCIAEAPGQLKWSWFQKPRPLANLVIFDDACRGAWGSVKLIGSLHSTGLASLGAALTILALVSDPFIQQVGRYDPCVRAAEKGLASVARTNNYTVTGMHNGAGTETLDLSMQAAIIKGMYKSFSPITLTCSTGNCTFPEYRTLGVCGGCVNATNKIEYGCTKYSVNNFTSEDCIWQLPSGLNISREPPIVMVIDTVSFSSADADPSEILNTAEMLFYTQSSGYSTSNDSVGETSVPYTNVMALRCSLWPCVRTYRGRVDQGETTEQLISTHNMTRNMSLLAYDMTLGFVATPMPCLINGSYFAASSLANQSIAVLSGSVDKYQFNLTDPLPLDCYFNYADPLGLVQFLDRFLVGSAARSDYSDDEDPTWMGLLWNDGNASLQTMNTAWGDLAEPMTIQIRQTGDPSNSAPTVGQALQTETWTVVLLIATLVITEKCSGPNWLWSASPLALLFHGLDDDSRDRGRSLNDLGEMKRLAGGLYAKVVDDGTGAGFVGHSGW